MNTWTSILILVSLLLLSGLDTIEAIPWNNGTSMIIPPPSSPRLVSTMSWTQASAAPEARVFAGLSILMWGAVLLFGGKGASGALTDAWIFESGMWWTVCPIESPIWPQARSNMIFEYAGNGEVFLYGGVDDVGGAITDSFLFSATSMKWISLTPTGPSPGAVLYPMGAALLGLDQVAVFGGQLVSLIHLRDTYIYSKKTNSWEQLSIPGPSARSMGVMTSSEWKGAILYGGLAATGDFLSDVWYFNATGRFWTELQAIGSIPLPCMNMMFASIYNGSVILAGGFQGSSIVNTAHMMTVLYENDKSINGQVTFSSLDTSLINNKLVQGGVGAPLYDVAFFFGGSGESLSDLKENTIAWIPTVDFMIVPVKTAPPPRYLASMNQIVTGFVVLFGGRGIGQNEFLNDTWIFMLSGTWVTWAQPNSTYTPPALAASCLVEAGENRLLLFGGYLPGTIATNEAWTFSLTDFKPSTVNGQWSPVLNSSHTPSPRAFAMGSYAGNDTSIIFGGMNANAYTDVHAFNSVTREWRLINIVSQDEPPALYGAAMTSVVINGQYVSILFGGTSEAGDTLDDTWMLAMTGYATAKWAKLLQVQDGTGPSNRMGCTLSPLYDSVVMIGGQSSQGAFDDSPWVLNMTVAMLQFDDRMAVPVDAWKRVKQSVNPPLRTHGSSGTLSNNTIVLFGGETLFEQRLGTVWVGVSHEFLASTDVAAANDNPTWKLWEMLVVGGAGGLALILAAVTGFSLYSMRKQRAMIMHHPLVERDSSNEEWLSFADITLGSVIGSGGAGTVFRGLCLQAPAAVKRMHCAIGDSTEWKEEVKMMKSLRHPNILLLIGACKDPRSGELYIVTELAPLGDLNKYLRENQDLSKKTRLLLTTDMARGLLFLHSRSIIHRDLKSPNLLVFAGPSLKVGDFGLSRRLQSDSVTQNVQTSVAGTPLWTAPESLEHAIFSTASDVYSFAIVVWELFTGKVPYDGERLGFNLLQQIIQGKRPTIPDTVPAEVSDLMQACWDAEASKRPSMNIVVSQLDSLTEAVTGRSVSLSDEEHF